MQACLHTHIPAQHRQIAPNPVVLDSEHGVLFMLGQFVFVNVQSATCIVRVCIMHVVVGVG